MKTRNPCRCACRVDYAQGHGSVHWDALGKNRAIALVAEQVGRIKERGHPLDSATVTTARGVTYDVLALLLEP